jgi:hypothetical protein
MARRTASETACDLIDLVAGEEDVVVELFLNTLLHLKAERLGIVRQVFGTGKLVGCGNAHGFADFLPLPPRGLERGILLRP